MGISQRPMYGKENVIEFRTNEITPFKQLFDSIKNKLPDTRLLFGRDGMRILQVDATTTFLVDVRLEGDNFEHFYCNPSAEHDHGNETMVEINLNAIYLNSVFKGVSKDDTQFIFTYKRKSDKVTIVFERAASNEVRVFEIPIQIPDEDDDMAQIDISDMDEYEYSLSLPSADLVKICRDLKYVNCEKVQIIHTGKSLIFEDRDNFKARIERTAKHNDGQGKDGLVFTKVPEDTKGIYCDSFKFSTFYEFSKSQSSGGSSSKTELVKILLSRDRPMILHYEIGTLGQMNVALAAYAAEEENDED